MSGADSEAEGGAAKAMHLAARDPVSVTRAQLLALLPTGWFALSELMHLTGEDEAGVRAALEALTVEGYRIAINRAGKVRIKTTEGGPPLWRR